MAVLSSPFGRRQCSRLCIVETSPSERPISILARRSEVNKSSRNSGRANVGKVQSPRRRSVSRTRRVSQRNRYSPVFFVALVATVLSTLGFVGLVATVLAGS